MTFLRSVDRLLSRIEFSLLVAFLGSMVVLAFAQVVMRNFLGTGFIWADTIIRHLVLWAGFTGATLAAGEGRHIGIDALTKFFSEGTRRAVSIITNIFTVVVCFYLADAAWTFLVAEREAGGDIALAIPTWVAIAVIPTGYALLAFHFLVKAIEAAHSLFSRKGGAA